MAQLNVTELDFENIKQNLKTFLQSQEEFTDYNFDGSALSVLIDTLAYNTHYNGILAHMVSNESFLDSAIKRSSVVSLAKALGYIPRSARAATASIEFVVTPPGGNTDLLFTLSRNTPFISSVNGTTFTFYPSEDVTAAKSGDTFTFSPLLLKEGTRVNNQFIIGAGKETDAIVLPNANVDTTTIRVRVSENGFTLNSTVTYRPSVGLINVTSTTPAYWLEETIDGYYSLRFGDDVLGRKLTAGNVVIVDYLKTNGPDANRAKTFSCNSTIIGSGETKTFTSANTIVASGGQLKEGIDSIRKNAPSFYTTRDRAVTADDYKALILASNANIQSVSVWGGEQNDPPIYGKIFISLDPIAGQVITDQDKDNIRLSVINPKGSIGTLTEFVDPEYTYIGLKISTIFDPNITIQNASQITTIIKTSVNNYFNNSLNTLNKNFYYSKLHDIIKGATNSLLSVNISPILQKRFIPNLNVDDNYTINFNTKLQPRELTSTWFNVDINGATYKAKFQDVPNSTVISPDYTGSGVVYLQSSTGSTIGNVGIINYTTGQLKVSVKVSSLFGAEESIRVNIKPNNEVKDILTSVLTRTSAVSNAAVLAYPAKNTILSLDDTSANDATGAKSGLVVTVTPKIEEY